ncbi:MAG: extracellular solute-binding protein [Gammaproteobacteria bacterium]|nr:extracellular solute-binding protein [Gammaproteobacteria bacterium]
MKQRLTQGLLLLTGLSIFLLFNISTTYADDGIIVFSGRSDKFIKPVIKVFTEQTGIKVTLHNAKSTALINKLRFEAQHTKADLFISNDAGNLQIGSELDLFQPIPDKVIAVIPENYRAADKTWVGLSARARVLVVNKNATDISFVNSVFDLANPKLKNRLGITNNTNESYIAGTTVYMLATDRDTTKSWLQGIKANVGSDVFNKHSKIVKAVAKGKKDVGLVNHYYIYRYLAENPDAPIKIILPDQQKGQMGVAWNVAGIAISKHTKKKEAAIKFVTFLLSEQGQALFAKVNREYPTRPDIATAPEVPAADSFKVANIPMYELGKQRNATIDLIEEVGMP